MTITNGELHRALRLLIERGAWGIERKEFEELFGSDRRGRQIMAELRKRGWAAVVVTSGLEGKEVYRIAENEAEYHEYRAKLVSRIKELEAALAGLDRAWREGGVREEQKTLF